jgi:long-chain acyl-CoA synthetase
MERIWNRFYEPGVPSTIEYQDETLPAMLERVASEHGDEPATLFQGKQLTYAELQGQVESLAGGLIDAGFAPGERIAIMMPNLPQFPIAFYGALRAGLVVVPTNPLYTPRELAHQLRDSGSSAIITLPQLLGKVAPAIRGTDVRWIVLANVADALPWPARLAYRVKTRFSHGSTPNEQVPDGDEQGSTTLEGVAGDSRVTVKSWKDLIGSHSTHPARPSAPDDLAVLQYTGGTTGTSKAAMLTHRNLLANAAQVFSWQGTVAGPMRTLCATPFFHVYGLTVGMNMTVFGHGLMILLPRFEPEAVRDAIRKLRPNLFPGVPTMYVALNALPGAKPADFNSLQVCISGASALPAAVQHDFSGRAPDARLVEGYGLTGAGPVTHCNPVGGQQSRGIGLPLS